MGVFNFPERIQAALITKTEDVAPAKLENVEKSENIQIWNSIAKQFDVPVIEKGKGVGYIARKFLFETFRKYFREESKLVALVLEHFQKFSMMFEIFEDIVALFLGSIIFFT